MFGNRQGCLGLRVQLSIFNNDRDDGSLVLSASASAATSFMDRDNANNVNRKRDLCDSFNDVGNRNVDRIMTIVFPDVSSIVIRGRNLEDHTLIPDSSARRFMLCLRHLILFRLRLHSISQPSHIAATPEVMRLRTRAVKVSIARGGLCLTIICLSFDEPNESNDSEFMIRINAGVEVRNSLIVNHYERARLRETNSVTDRCNGLTSLRFRHTLVANDNRSNCLGQVTINVRGFRFTIFGNGLANVNAIVPFMTVNHTTRCRLVINGKDVNREYP